MLLRLKGSIPQTQYQAFENEHDHRATRNQAAVIVYDALADPVHCAKAPSIRNQVLAEK